MERDPELHPDEVISRGYRASELLAHPAFQDAWNREMKRLTHAWVNGTNSTLEEREELHKDMRSWKRLHGTLTKWVQQGESAAVKMAEQIAKPNGAGERSSG